MKQFLINIIARFIVWRIRRKLKKVGFFTDMSDSNRTRLIMEKLFDKDFTDSVIKDFGDIDKKREIMESKVNVLKANDRLNDPDDDEDVDYKNDEQDKRICSIFKTNKTPKVNGRSLSTFKNYLKMNINHPCHVTGIEDMGCFGWEEPYVLGLWDEDEYKELKKTQASYTDVYEMIRFNDKIDREHGIMVRVKRLSDSKIFTLTLADLEANDEKSKNYELLNDYSVWFVNNHS